MADAARSKPVVAAEFAQSARNGVAIQAGDTRHQGDATIPLLLGQQGDQLATTMLISPSDQSVDGAMVLCRDAVRMLSAGRAARSSAVPSWCSPFLLALWCSSPCSLWQEDSSIAILPKPAEVIFAHRLSGQAERNEARYAWATLARSAIALITLAPKKLIRTRRASEGSASEPSLARRVSMCKDAKLSCRGNSRRLE